ncbi:DUF6531 domain-containing protein [Escherichia coli]|uniref:DUF6531 domain-containing protein n=1 Tax=Escherichia coli TaxID=562 RepID=UPI002078AAC2|nr:DUF6531 domain-containing protein [Escherichia coli]
MLSRTYSSYRTKTPAPVGSLGPGWKMPADIRLQLRDNTLILSDNGGRSLYFDVLSPARRCRNGNGFPAGPCDGAPPSGPGIYHRK